MRGHWQTSSVSAAAMFAFIIGLCIGTTLANKGWNISEVAMNWGSLIAGGLAIIAALIAAAPVRQQLTEMGRQSAAIAIPIARDFTDQYKSDYIVCSQLLWAMRKGGRSVSTIILPQNTYAVFEWPPEAKFTEFQLLAWRHIEDNILTTSELDVLRTSAQFINEIDVLYSDLKFFAEDAAPEAFPTNEFRTAWEDARDLYPQAIRSLEKVAGILSRRKSSAARLVGDLRQRVVGSD